MAERIGKYRLDRLIGEGGFGRVYQGVDEQLQRPVAVKVLKDDRMRDPSWVERFQREAVLASRLRHPSIVNVLDAGVVDGRSFLVMDLLEGQPLSALMKSGEAFSVERTAAILAPIADALDYAHTKDLLHRDVKPSNIVLDDHGCPVLTDFGLVKSMSEVDSLTSTTTGVMMGTVEYMSPEQITGKALQPSSDLYALAVIAFQMLTGQLPFTGDTPFEVQLGHVQKTPPNPRSLRPELPKEVDAILNKALGKNPAQRYASGKEFVIALKQVSDRASREAAEELSRQAEAKAEELDFDEALRLLKSAQAVMETPRQAALMEEYERRKKIQVEYQQILQQVSQLQVRRQLIEASEHWMFRKEELTVYRPEQPVDTKKLEGIREIIDNQTKVESHKTSAPKKDSGGIGNIGWILGTIGILLFIDGIWGNLPGVSMAGGFIAVLTLILALIMTNLSD